MADVPAVSAAGLAVAALSMVGNGSFGVFAKLCAKEPDPVVFNSFLALGVMVSSLLVLPFLGFVEGGVTHLQWTWFGALAGALLVIATLFSFMAISLSGLATAQATWSCLAMLVAFLWGVCGPSRDGAGPGQPVKSVGHAALSVALLVAGVVVINTAGPLAKLRLRQRARGPLQRALTPPGGLDSLDSKSSAGRPSASASDACPGALEAAGEEPAGEEACAAPASGGGVLRSAGGCLAAAVVGVAGGSILVPMSFVPRESAGLQTLLPLGVTSGIMGVLVGLLYWVAYRQEPLSWSPSSSLRQELRLDVAIYGILSGVVWNAGNVCQIIALHYLHMPYGVSYPILQCALIVAGLWGIVMFKEVSDCGEILVFCLGVCILLLGVVLLGMYGPGA